MATLQEKGKAGELLANLEKLHTTELGAARIRKNLSLKQADAMHWCRAKIGQAGAQIERKGKNWYVLVEGCVITVNASSYTVITAHALKGAPRQCGLTNAGPDATITP